MVKYWNEILKNLSQDQRKETFKFMVNEIIYKVPLSYAIGVSPLVTIQYMKDTSFNELNLNIKINNIKEEKIQEEFSKFIKGENISNEIFFEIGIQLGNKDMIREWKKNQELSKEIIIKSIKAYNKFISINNLQNENIQYTNEEIENIQEELEYIGEHFEEMKEEIKELNEEEIIFILKNKKTKVSKEDIIWEIIKEIIENKYQNKYQNNNKSILIGIVEGKYLSIEKFKEYLEKIEEEDIIREPKILKNLKDILIKNIKNIDNIKLKEKTKEEKRGREIKHQNGENFQGILRYLQNKYGKTIHQKGIISISASSGGGPEIAIDYDNQNTNDRWCSANVPNSWLEIDFKKQKVKINGYSIKTMDSEPNENDHLKNWVIEGSKDKNTWIEIDKQENNNYLNGPNYEHYFEISKTNEEFQYIRIRSIGKNHYNRNYLDFSRIEFYGEIFEQ